MIFLCIFDRRNPTVRHTRMADDRAVKGAMICQRIDNSTPCKADSPFGSSTRAAKTPAVKSAAPFDTCQSTAIWRLQNGTGGNHSVDLGMRNAWY